MTSFLHRIIRYENWKVFIENEIAGIYATMTAKNQEKVEIHEDLSDLVDAERIESEIQSLNTKINFVIII